MYYPISDCIFYSFILGLCFGVVYEILRIVRKLLNLKAVTVICDIAFFVISAFAVFMLSVSLGNDVRIYTIIGYGCGVFAYIVTIGRLINSIETKIVRAIHFIIRRICKAFEPVFSFIAHISGKTLGSIHDFFAYPHKNSKKHLQTNDVQCYNNIYNRNSMGENSHVIKAQVRKG